MMSDMTAAAKEALRSGGGTAPQQTGKLHMLGRRTEPSRPTTEDAAVEALSEGGEVPFEDDDSLVEEALAEDAEAESSLKGE